MRKVTEGRNFVKVLTYSGICVALSAVLASVKLFNLPQGGSVTACSMLFIVLVGYWFGARAGVTAGVVLSLIRLAMGDPFYHPVELILDYPLAFGVLGFGGMFGRAKFSLQLGYAVCALLRFVCSFVAGFVFFGSYAPAGQNVFVYSALYNLSYILPEMIITLIIISLPPVRAVIERIGADAAL